MVPPEKNVSLTSQRREWKVGAVAIGRNEGERLKRCLRALVGKVEAVVYVDSGSSDDSVAFANGLGVEVVELDMSEPFTMARGRNAGWQCLLRKHPEIDVIQFLDGDVELVSGWLAQALWVLQSNPCVTIVSGRRRERQREQTIYNRLTDMEWDTRIGPTKAVLGDMMVKADAVRAVNGFNPSLIAAEDDDFCLRVSATVGGEVWRIDSDMSLHDAAITQFSQWWRRMVRAGYGFAQVGAIHSQYFVRERRRTWVWALVLPITAVGLAPFSNGLSLLLLLLYAVSILRTMHYRRSQGDNIRDSWQYALFVTLSKFPSLLGMLTFYKRRFFRQANTIIEYK